MLQTQLHYFRYRLYWIASFYFLIQIFESGLEGISVQDANKVSSGFPSFRVQDVTSGAQLGYLVYAGIMIGDTNKKMGRYHKHT